MGGVVFGAAFAVSVLSACTEPVSAPTKLPDGYPAQQVPVVGELRKAETIEVGRSMWRITVAGDDTVAGSRALLAAGLVPVAPNVPLDAGAVGAVYRGHGYTVAISSDDGDVTYVVSPTPGV